MTDLDLKHLFTYHPPTVEQTVRYEKLREAALAFATVIAENTHPCADQSAAIRKVREAMMTANVSIALEKKP